jgi:hypothetical protein
MITDATTLDPDLRVADRKLIEGYLSQTRTIDLPSEKFESLDFAELDAAVQAQDAATASATTGAILEMMKLIAAAALARDAKYAYAGRTAMTALAFNDIMFRTYRPACAAIKVGFK